jgi:hypothetical protein
MPSRPSLEAARGAGAAPSFSLSRHYCPASVTWFEHLRFPGTVLIIAIQPTKRNRAIKHGSQVLNRVGGQLIVERKQAAA